MTTILAGGRPLTLLPEKAAFIAASRDAAGRRRAHRQGGELSRPRRAGAARHDQRDARRRCRALVRRTGARADRLPRRLPAFGARARAGHARARWRAGARAHRVARAGAGARQPRRPRRRSAGAPRHRRRRRAARARTASRSATTRARSPAPTCWPATCIRASAWAGARCDQLRLPCFWFGDAVGVLPAFGAFTGMHPMRAGAGDRRLRGRRRRRSRAMPVARERVAA